MPPAEAPGLGQETELRLTKALPCLRSRVLHPNVSFVLETVVPVTALLKPSPEQVVWTTLKP